MTQDSFADLDPRVRRHIASAIFNAEFFRIYYFIPHFPQDVRNSSHFQGFTEGILRTVNLFARALAAPADMREIFEEVDVVIPLRVAGEIQPRIAPIDITYLRQVLDMGEIVFACILSNDSTLAAAVDAIVAERPIPILHMSTETAFARVDVADKSLDPFRKYVAAVVEILRARGSGEPIVRAYDEIKQGQRRNPARALSLEKRNHNVTAPNELALEVANFAFRRERPINSTQDHNYVSAIARSFDAIANRRKQILKRQPFLESEMPYKAVVALPSVFALHHGPARSLKNPIAKADRDAIRKVIRYFVRGETFAMRGEDTDLLPALENRFCQFIIQMRSEELSAFTVAVAMYTVSCFAPALRLPPGVNKVREQLFKIGNCSRGNSPHRRFKLNKLVGLAEAQMLEVVPKELMSRITSLCDGRGSIKLLTDLPLEWIPINGVPLALRQDCSRIPVTPGNLFFGESCPHGKLVLNSLALDEVLIIRSFGKSDPIRGVLERAIRLFSADAGKDYPKYRFVDVENEQSLRAALNGFEGAIVIFDCHGHWGQRDDVGTLMIGGQPLDVWGLRGKAKIPPIVILGACDTHPLDGSHASVGNGMIACGALTVLATTLPIDVLKSSMFVARLLFRMKSYVEIHTQQLDRPLSWVRVISGMQRMTYVTEVLQELISPGGISLSEDARRKIGYQANNWINSGEPAWYERTVRFIASSADIERSRLNKLIAERAKITDCLKYVQLGNPDRIWIASKSMSVANRRLQSGSRQTLS